MGKKTRIVVVRSEKTCDACPSQWDAWTDDDRLVYVRYRNGYLSVRISETGCTDDMDAVSGEEIVSKYIGDGLDGILDYKDLVKETLHVIQWPGEPDINPVARVTNLETGEEVLITGPEQLGEVLDRMFPDTENEEV